MARVIKVENIEQKSQIIEYLRSGVFPDGLDKDQKRRFREKASHFLFLNDAFCFRKNDGRISRAVFDFETDVVKLILDEEHRIGHPGMTKMIDIIHRKYYGISSSVIMNYVRACEACSSTNTLRTVQEIHVNEITAKYDRYIMDCVDLRHYSQYNDGYSWILNVIDTYTKFLFSFKMKNKTASSVKECLDQIYMTFGVPVTIQADNGKEFSNQLLRDFHARLNIRVIHGRPRTPRAQGQVERVNQTIKRWLSKSLYHTTEKRWIDYLQPVVFIYNITRHRATNQSPFMLFHGHPGFNNFQPILEEFELMDDNVDQGLDEHTQWFFNDVQEFTPEEQSIHDTVMDHFTHYRQAMIANSNPNTRNRRIAIDDIVLVKADFDNNTSNRRNAFDGFFENDRYVVIALLENNMIKIKNLQTQEVRFVYRNRLKKVN